MGGFRPAECQIALLGADAYFGEGDGIDVKRVMVAEEFQTVVEQRIDISGAGIDVLLVVLVARLDEDGGNRLLHAFDFGFPWRDAAEFVVGEGGVVRVLEADVEGVLLESGFARIDFIHFGEVLDAHAEGEVDDADGGARVHAIVPRGGGLPSVRQQRECGVGVVAGNPDVFHFIGGEGGIDALSHRGGRGPEHRVEVSLTPLPDRQHANGTGGER